MSFSRTFAARLTCVVMLGASALAATACTPALSAADVAQRERLAIEKRLDGVWRMSSYVPEQQLSLALLLSMQSDSISVRFDRGRVSSATSALTFDRAYRLADIVGQRFKLFIQDESNVEYECIGEFDENGRILFKAHTAPWRGTGILEREGPRITY